MFHIGRLPQQSYSNAGTASEEFADQFLGWTYYTWASNPAGQMRSEWMDKYMPGWVNKAPGQ